MTSASGDHSSQALDGENFLINTYDNKVKKAIRFDTCSMETTEIFPIVWEYADFDKVRWPT